MTAFHRKEETMNIEFKCPQCGKSVECDETFRGQVAECPHCGKGIVVPREKPRMQMPKTPMQRYMDDEKASGVHAPNVPSSNSQPDHVKVDPLPIPSETECLKAWAKYWLARLLIVFCVSFGLGFLGGFVGRLTGCAPFIDWPKEGAQRLGHIAVYLAFVLGVYMSWRLAWWGYKRYAVRNLLHEQPASNMLSSWLVPILVNTALSLLMPMSLQIALLGVYGYIVWCFTIWIFIDYLMFRFMSVNLLCGRNIDSRWICPAILFCIFVVVMFGFAQIIESVRSAESARHHDASQIYDRMKQMDDSRHHDASQIYDRPGRMKIY